MSKLFEYLPDATNFDGMEKEAKPEHHMLRNWECPLCKGYGGWNLQLDAYGPGKHFQASCSQCNGWGWVDESDRKCLHEYESQPSRVMFDHAYKCKKCGKEVTYDSSG